MAKIRYINKIILLFCAMIISPAYSLDMCAENNSVVVVLDPSINLSSSSGHNNTATFKVVGSYGTLTGVSACLSFSGSGVYTANNGLLMDNGDVVTGGEQNGQYCWCQITHPVKTLWFYYGYWTSGGLSTCLANCANSCGLDVKGTSSKRATVFNTVGRY
jgi:hypothetical protein